MIEYKAVKNPWYGKTCSQAPGDKFPYQYSPVIDDVRYGWVAETPDIAMLLGLGLKYEKGTVRFHFYALRILGLNSGWAGTVDKIEKYALDLEPVEVTRMEGKETYRIRHGNQVTIKHFEHQETALMFALGQKYINDGAGFAKIACKMLGIEDRYL